jgi:CRP-like cAMP-binding protein
METLRKLLDAECNYRMKEETMDHFLGMMTEKEYKRGESVINYGELDTNIYVVKEGIMRVAYFDGFKEKTFGFGLPGTIFMSYYSYLQNELSYCKYEAACDSVFMKIPKSKFSEFIRQSHDFAQWMLSMSLTALLFHEKKLGIVNGDAKERLEALIENRPEIIEKVNSKILASYIGITQSDLSTLKKQFAEKLKK